MNNPVGYLMEPLLSQFFLVDAICKGFLDEAQREETFREMAQVFCVPMNQQTQAYFHAANDSDYKRITDYAAYERLCRTIEFAQASGQDVALTAMDRVILAQKRASMKIKSEIFQQCKNLTADIIADTLLRTALNGNVDAMVILAYMEYHGLCICQDRENAIKRLRLCAKWNNLFGNLMGIAYDKANEDRYYNTLYTILRSANQREIFHGICTYRQDQRVYEKDPVARTIEKAFGMGIVKRNTYDQIFAKVAFSPLISDEDKEKLLLNKKQDAIASLSDIPFDVERDRRFTFQRAKAQNLPLKREAELQEIFCHLSPAVSGRSQLYRPLLVAVDDAYVADMYAGALKAGFAAKTPVIEVDAGALNPQDFVGAKEHFLLRGLSETKQSHTVFLVKHCEELGETELEELIKLLDYAYRRKFKLLEPTVSLDLSDVLIVLFASEVNSRVRKLASVCEAVEPQRISDAEKHTVIDATFRTRAKQFGIQRARLEQEGREFLAPFKTGQIIRILDGALKKAAFDNKTVVTAAALRSVSAHQSFAPGKREFGYLGGGFHEEY